VRIRQVRAHAFGPFQEATLGLAEGMTVIVGPNESGKSSWHAAIYAALCGMRRARGRRTSDDEQFATRHQPWDGERWEVSCVIDLPDGRTVEIRNDLAGRVDSTARDLSLGHDVTAEIIHDGAPDGSRWLGLERRAYLAVACVRQAEILAVTEQAGALQRHLERAAATAGTDETTAAALAAIEEYLKEHVGQERRNSTKPLMQAIRTLEEADRTHREAVEAHDDWLRRQEQLAELEDSTRQAHDRARTAEAAHARRSAATLQDRFRRARQLAERHRTPPPELQADDELAQQVTTALHDWENRPHPEPLTGPTAAQLDAHLADLPAMPEGDLEPEPAVLHARQELVNAHSRHEAHRQQAPADAPPLEAGGASESELIDLARDLETPVPAVDATLAAQVERLRQQSAVPPTRRMSPLGVATAILAVAGVSGGVGLLAAGQAVAGMVGLVAGAALAAVAAVVLLRGGPALAAGAGAELQTAEARLLMAEQLAASARERRDQAASRATVLGLDPDPARLRHMADQLRRAEQAASDRRQWEERNSQRARAVEEACERLRAALASRDVIVAVEVDPDTLLRAVDDYEQACRARQKTAAAAGQRPTLERELEARRRAEQRLAHDEAAVEAARAALRAAAVAAGIVDEATAPACHEDELVKSLQAWEQEREQRRAASEAARREWAELQAILDGRSMEDLEAETQHALERATELATGLDPGTLDEFDLGPDPGDTVRRLQRAASDVERDLAAARSRLDERAERLTPVAEAEEALEAAKSELDRVRTLEATLRTTKQFMREAQDRVHRDIAPAVVARVQDRLARVTGNRYSEVTVDPQSLEVHVRDTAGHFRKAEQLSHGTAEQVFLLLRVAMAEILSLPDTRCPLLLDDVTVQSDPVRTRAILDVLHEISSDHQVILLSQEDEVTSWAERHLGERDELVKLPAPSERHLTAAV
jgi:DNA repair protein SbcC/Rad50